MLWNAATPVCAWMEMLKQMRNVALAGVHVGLRPSGVRWDTDQKTTASYTSLVSFLLLRECWNNIFLPNWKGKFCEHRLLIRACTLCSGARRHTNGWLQIHFTCTSRSNRPCAGWHACCCLCKWASLKTTGRRLQCRWGPAVEEEGGGRGVGGQGWGWGVLIL